MKPLIPTCAALARFVIPALLAISCCWTVPRWWCGLDGEKWFSGSLSLVEPLADEVSATVGRGISASDFTSDSNLFRHEWQFGTYQMAALGLLQVCIEHPELKKKYLPAAELAIDRILSREIRAFDASRWKEDPLESLGSANGHAAYLGYTNLILSVHRQVESHSRYADLNDRISDALDRRLRESKTGILETYPGESYPVDNASVLASLLLHEKQTGIRHSIVTEPMLRRFRDDWREKRSGLLFQAVDTETGSPLDLPRASGTSLAAYFISFGDHPTASQLFDSLRRECARSVAGFGYVREYPEGFSGNGDIDSGPVFFGASISGSGFSLASARIYNNHSLFLALYRTTYLIGAPVYEKHHLQFAMGGPLGNAILLAMLTATPALQ